MTHECGPYGPYEDGDLVQTFFDNGLGGTTLYGIVEQAGPKRFAVRWESNICNRFEQNYHMKRADFHIGVDEESQRFADEIKSKLENLAKQAKEKRKRR